MFLKNKIFQYFQKIRFYKNLIALIFFNFYKLKIIEIKLN
jgi:hypothetical protein